MSYSISSCDNHVKSKNYLPCNTPNKIYISSSIYDLQQLIDVADCNWPGIPFDMIDIDTEYIQTRHIGYDLYDPSDYDTFITLTKRLR